MATVKTIYLGDLRTENEHLQSGNKILTDAPTDNQGKGEYFSPTDLLATALGNCIMTIMGIQSGIGHMDASRRFWRNPQVFRQAPGPATRTSPAAVDTVPFTVLPP